MVAVFREVKRVLRQDGTCWVNLGDSYAAGSSNGKFGPNSTVSAGSKARSADERVYVHKPPPGLKPKDLVGIPWLIAKALQQPYYTGRIKNERDRVWLAATIDAEGTICGFTHKRKDNGDIRRGIHITVTNSNRLMLDECYRIWKTSRHDHNPHGNGHLGKLDIFRWIAHDIFEKSQLLAELYPYFICKKKQALLAWNFLEISKEARGRNINEINRERCAWIVHALSKLNHLESVDIPNWVKEPPSLYEQGWYLRNDIIWAKPNPMPESVSDRCTKAHEYIFLLSKSADYYFDQDAVRETGSGRSCGNVNYKYDGLPGHETKHGILKVADVEWNQRNIRTVWEIATQPYPDAHFATFPEEIAKRCIMAGTSERGCCAKCGAPWERMTERGENTGTDGKQDNSAVTLRNDALRHSGRIGETPRLTLGWQPTCTHDADTSPCVVLDPFAGSGTVGQVALELGRKAILIELNPKYCELIERRTQVTYGMQF